MFASGLSDPKLIPSYVGICLGLVVIYGSVARLLGIARQVGQVRNRALHELKWAGLIACFLIMLVKSLLRVWYIASGRGNGFVDESWWEHLWVIWAVSAACTAALAVYLHWADRPFPAGHCKTCGYDLKGNVSGACPECGGRQSS